MKVKVLKKTKRTSLKLKLKAQTTASVTCFRKRLLEDKKVDLAGYDVPHPLASSPIIYIRMKGKVKPEDTLIAAAKKARADNEAFSKELAKALKA